MLSTRPVNSFRTTAKPRLLAVTALRHSVRKSSLAERYSGSVSSPP